MPLNRKRTLVTDTATYKALHLIVSLQYFIYATLIERIRLCDTQAFLSRYDEKCHYRLNQFSFFCLFLKATRLSLSLTVYILRKFEIEAFSWTYIIIDRIGRFINLKVINKLINNILDV